ncbi:MAG: 4'-phosphopantetheinyl transferase superfamily protein [Myxococcota bacterium]|nr:4'-phosphopantetheinyl transferase superfamily protein [Myxococcota bacterium]
MAAASRLSACVGLGVDVEKVPPPKTLAAVLELALSRQESVACHRLARKGRASFAQAVTTIFSAKESLYKCIQSFVPSRFDFLDVELAELDWEAGVVALAVSARGAGNVSRGALSRCEGRFSVDGDWVWSGTWSLAPTAGRPPRPGHVGA